jgi:hypothetical protein
MACGGPTGRSPGASGRRYRASRSPMSRAASGGRAAPLKIITAALVALAALAAILTWAGVRP